MPADKPQDPIEIKRLAVIVELSDGTTRQVLYDKSHKEKIIWAVQSVSHGQIRVSNEVLKSIFIR